MISQIGLPLSSLAQNERTSLQATYNAMVADDSQSTALNTVAQTYSQVSTRVSTLLMPAVTGSGNGQSIFQLTMNDGYVATADSNGHLSYTPNSSYNNAGQITVVLTTSDGTLYTLVATDAGGYWTLTQTSSNDKSLNYQLVISDSIIASGVNSTFSGKISLTDESLTTPVIYNGTVTTARHGRAELYVHRLHRDADFATGQRLRQLHCRLPGYRAGRCDDG